VPNFSNPNSRRPQSEADLIECWHRRGRRWTVWCSSLVWGGLMFIWMTALDLIRRPDQQFKGLSEVLWLLFTLSLYLTFGYAIGVMFWQRIERKKRNLDDRE
jgi:hypothetical protein